MRSSQILPSIQASSTIRTLFSKQFKTQILSICFPVYSQIHWTTRISTKVPWTETSIWVDLSLHWILLQTPLYSLRSCSLKLTPVFWYTRRAPPSTSDQYAAIPLTDVTNVPSESNLFSLKRNHSLQNIFSSHFFVLSTLEDFNKVWLLLICFLLVDKVRCKRVVVWCNLLNPVRAAFLTHRPLCWGMQRMVYH